MSNFDLTAVPNIVVMKMRDNSGVYDSPLVASQQTVDRGGLHWALAYTYTELRGDVRGDLLGTITALRGRAHRLRVPVYDNEKRGAYGGTPLVDGASQTGSSINLKGCSNSITDWIKRGDYFSIDVNGEHELKMATADASSGGTGLITISFEPRLRYSPLNSAAVYVEDGVLSKPYGIFLTDGNELAWSSRPGVNKRTAISLSLIEDMLATAP